jgi:transcriptional regulator with XRE-family HTH domain
MRIQRKAHEEDFLRKLGKTIRIYRVKKRLTQELLGVMSGVNPKYIGELERGEKNPTALILRKIAKACDTSLSELFHFETVAN